MEKRLSLSINELTHLLRQTAAKHNRWLREVSTGKFTLDWQPERDEWELTPADSSSKE